MKRTFVFAIVLCGCGPRTTVVQEFVVVCEAGPGAVVPGDVGASETTGDVAPTDVAPMDVAPACAVDGIKDGDETDVDCGGVSCPPCALSKRCVLDADCITDACNPITNLCVADQCADRRKNGVETDIDCGGGSCPACVNGKGCEVDSDCSSTACDGVSFTCVVDPCADHRQDGAETDIDCGGGACTQCGPGKHCKSNFDCVAGHFCNGVKICQ